jgi:putative redox protein
MADMEVTLDGGKVVTAHINGKTIKTDQSVRNGGGGTAPEPFELFLASIGTCAGIYVKSFCDQRGIPADGIKIIQSVVFDPEKRARHYLSWIFSCLQSSRKNTGQRWSMQQSSAW